jgi:hypothetical protein
VSHNTDGPDAARDAVEELQHDAFANAKRAVDRARIILAGEAPVELDDPEHASAAVQAIREPSPDTVQNPAGE